MNIKTEVAMGQPCVGIYWGISNQSGEISIVVDVSILAEAEPYGNFLTHPRGHYEVWEAWRRVGTHGLAQRGLPDVFQINEYEDFPRGRVVYDGEHKRFVVYADRRLQTLAIIADIVRAFHLESESYIIQSDSHYRS